MLEPPAGFVWVQPDAGKLRCTECGEIVQAVTVDLHHCEANQ